MVIIRNEPTAEGHERRLRYRHAVLAALAASGMTPEDTTHIQYFTLDKQARQAPSGAVHVPYEWFRRERLYPAPDQSGADTRPKHTVVVWLPQSLFLERPLTRLIDILNQIGCPTSSADFRARLHSESGGMRVDLIGPD